MDKLKVDLLIHRYSSSDAELEKWTAFVEKYLMYCLEQKEVEVKLIGSSALESSEDRVRIYIPVFTVKSINDPDYKDQVNKIATSFEGNGWIKIALQKEAACSEKVTSEFSGLKVIKMNLIDKDTGREVLDKDLWKKENFNYFLFKIFDLCKEVENSLKSYSDNPEVKNVKGVYLAEASPDLISVREEVSRELVRHGYEVYPSKPFTGASKEVEKAMTTYLQKSSLSVHIFGKLYEEVAEGEMSMSERENIVAANFYSQRKDKKSSHSFNRIIWFPDNLIVSNEKQIKFLEKIQKDKKLYAGAEIIRSSVEELKDIILEKLSEEGEPSSGSGSSGNEEKIIDKKIVYLVNSEKNNDGAQVVKKMLESMGCEVLFDNETKKSAEVVIPKYDSVLFYYQNEEATWLRSKMCELYKTKSWEFTSTFTRRGIITFENTEIPADDIFKGVIQIKAESQLEEDSLASFFVRN